MIRVTIGQGLVWQFNLFRRASLDVHSNLVSRHCPVLTEVVWKGDYNL